MSPRTATFLTALGLLAAGAPLPFLLHHHAGACCAHHHHHEHEAELRATENSLRVPAAIRCSAAPLSLRLMLGDSVLAEAPAEVTLWEPTLTLPEAETYDIEVQAEWADDAPHALTLTLDLPRRETRSLTRWASRSLHTLLHFSW